MSLNWLYALGRFLRGLVALLGSDKEAKRDAGQSKLDAILVQHLQTALRDVDRRLKRCEQRHEDDWAKIEELSQKVLEHQRTIDRQEQKIQTQEQKIQALEAEIASLKKANSP